jgi:hypothetical protein
MQPFLHTDMVTLMYALLPLCVEAVAQSSIFILPMSVLCMLLVKTHS